MTFDHGRGDDAGTTASSPHALYDLADVAAALGGAPAPDDEAFHEDGGGLGASRKRLRDMLERGERGRWRRGAHGTPAGIAAVEALGRRAPHLHELTDLVVRRLKASRTTRTPFVLPPLVLVGPPGVGKSWYLSALARALGLPFALHPFNLASLTDGLAGSHPGWRASAPGLVARTLLRGDVANPLVLVDEIDKPAHALHVGDAYRALYTLLEPACSSAFVDEHLGVPLDASAVSWVASANDLSDVPAPIRDRLTAIAVPGMGPAERAAVVLSVYRDANARYRFYFDPEPSRDVTARLADASPRRVRLAVDDAMVRAAADGRSALSPDDVTAPAPPRSRGPVH